MTVRFLYQRKKLQISAESELFFLITATTNCHKLNVVVQSLSHIWLFATSWTAARQASLSFTISQSLLKLTSIVLVIPFNHLLFCRPLLLLPSIFPSIRIFPMIRFFTSYYCLINWHPDLALNRLKWRSLVTIGDSLFPCLFLLLEATHIPWLMEPFLNIWIYQCCISLCLSCIVTSVSNSHFGLSSTFKDSSLHWDHPDNPERYLCFKISWLEIYIPYAI